MKHQYLAYGIALILASSCAIVKPDIKYRPKAQEDFIFPMQSQEFTQSVEDCMQKNNYPCDYQEPQDSLGEFINTWYSKHLISLKETKIYNLTGKDLKIIRYTNLGTWSKPFSYKIESTNGNHLGTYSKTNGLGGYRAGNRIKHREKEIAQNDWDLIKAKIDEIGFWQMPTHDPNMVLDGAEWILEILWNDKYHFVSRTSPGDWSGKKYAELCELIESKF